MVGNIKAPVLSLEQDVLKDVNGGDAVQGLWALFTKCKDSIQDGSRLENISWRLWFREMTRPSSSTYPSPAILHEKSLLGYPFPQLVTPAISEKQLLSEPRSELYRPASPTSPNLEAVASKKGLFPTKTSSSTPPVTHSPSSVSSVGLVICNITKEPSIAARNPTSISSSQPSIKLPPAPEVAIIPPSSSQQQHTITIVSAPTSLRADAVFPKVVVVNPTPHPTPPATPQAGPSVSNDADRPISPAPLLPPPHLSPHLPKVVEEPVPKATSTAPVAVAMKLAPVKTDMPPPPSAAPAKSSSRFFLPLASPVDNSGSSEGSSLALLATPEDRKPPPSVLDSTVHEDPVPLSQSPDHQPGTSVVSQTSIVSRASTSASKNASGKRSTSRTAAVRHTRPGLTRQASTGNRGAGKKSLAAGAMRRSSSTAETSKLTGLTGLTALTSSDKGKKRPAPVKTASSSKILAGPPSAKSAQKGKVPPSPVVKSGSKGKSGHLKGKKAGRVGGRGKGIMQEPESDEGESQEETDVDEVQEDEENEDESWDDLTPEELAKQAKADAAERRRLAKEAQIAAREAEFRETFRKRDPSEYKPQRTTSYLTMLMKPDPQQLPPDHPIRLMASTDNLAQGQHQQGQQYRRTQSTLGAPLRPMTAMAPPPSRAAKESGSLDASRRPAPSPGPPPVSRTPAISRTSSLLAFGGAAPSLALTKSSAALPAMETVTAFAPAQGAQMPIMNAATAMATIQTGKSASRAASKSRAASPRAKPSAQAESKDKSSPSSGSTGARYRPGGAPAGVDFETDSEDESSSENAIQVGRSYANQKLAELSQRRGTPKAPAPSPASPHNARPAPPSSVLLRQLPQKPPRPRSEPQLQEQPKGANPRGAPNAASTSTLATPTPVPIPADHPYNLPLAPPPTSPRTQRRLIVQKELSESLRRGLLWEHKVNRQPAAPPRRQGVLGPGGMLRPLTALENRTPEEQAKEQARQQRLDRQRLYKDDFHAHGW